MGFEKGSFNYLPLNFEAFFLKHPIFIQNLSGKKEIPDQKKVLFRLVFWN